MSELHCSAVYTDKGGVSIIVCGAPAFEIVQGNSLCRTCSERRDRQREQSRLRIPARRADLSMAYFCGKCGKIHAIGTKIWSQHTKHEAANPEPPFYHRLPATVGFTWHDAVSYQADSMASDAVD